jgi:hypothetical protein
VELIESYLRHFEVKRAASFLVQIIRQSKALKAFSIDSEYVLDSLMNGMELFNGTTVQMIRIGGFACSHPTLMHMTHNVFTRIRWLELQHTSVCLVKLFEVLPPTLQHLFVNRMAADCDASLPRIIKISLLSLRVRADHVDYVSEQCVHVISTLKQCTQLRYLKLDLPGRANNANWSYNMLVRVPMTIVHLDIPIHGGILDYAVHTFKEMKSLRKLYLRTCYADYYAKNQWIKQLFKHTMESQCSISLKQTTGPALTGKGAKCIPFHDILGSNRLIELDLKDLTIDLDVHDVHLQGLRFLTCKRLIIDSRHWISLDECITVGTHREPWDTVNDRLPRLIQIVINDTGMALTPKTKFEAETPSHPEFGRWEDL